MKSNRKRPKYSLKDPKGYKKSGGEELNPEELKEDDLKNQISKPLKSFLIICEGETEAAYFDSIRFFYNLGSIFDIKILPDQQNKEYGGASLKGMLYLAMKNQAKAKVPYDEIWIVTDNDEGNSFKLDNGTLSRIKDILPDNQYKELVKLQRREIENIRKEFQEEVYERIRYFLNEEDYLSFLAKIGISEEYLSALVEATTKGDEFEMLYSEQYSSFFYDAEGRFASTNNNPKNPQDIYKKKYFQPEKLKALQIAYTCISFEYWLLLHFEYCDFPFYNSREIIKYFDDNGYFTDKKTVIKNGISTVTDLVFKKGWFLFEERENKVIKEFFDKAEIAIRNNLISSSDIHGQINYEINPFSDVYLLTGKLLSLVFFQMNKQGKFAPFGNLLIRKNDSGIEGSLVYTAKAAIKSSEFTSLFTATDLFGNPMEANYLLSEDNKQLLRTNDKVKFSVTFKKDTEHIFLYLKSPQAGSNLQAIWYIPN